MAILELSNGEIFKVKKSVSIKDNKVKIDGNYICDTKQTKKEKDL